MTDINHLGPRYPPNRLSRASHTPQRLGDSGRRIGALDPAIEAAGPTARGQRDGPPPLDSPVSEVQCPERQRPESWAYDHPKTDVPVVAAGAVPVAVGTTDDPGNEVEPAAAPDAAYVLGRFQVLAPIARIVWVPEIGRARRRSPETPRPLPYVSGQVMNPLGVAPCG
jgi:hypothetical protein